MFGDTFVLPASTGNVTCNKINQDGYTSEYLGKVSGSEYRVRIRHSVVKATATRAAYDRHNVEVVQTVYAAGEVPQFDRKFYVVIENLPNDTDVVTVDALADWLIATANSNVTKLLGWQS